VGNKLVLTAVFISMLLLLAVVGTHLVNLGNANPYLREYVPPDAYTKPPKISIFAPLNNTAYMDTKIPLSINVTLPESTTASSTYVLAIYYEADWLDKRVYLYQSKSLGDKIASSQSNPKRHYFQYSGSLSGIPFGNHSIVVHAEGGGGYAPYCVFAIDGCSSVFFTTGIYVDTTPPRISLLSIENKTYDTTDVQLWFAVSETVSQISYVLDGQENVTINRDTVLAGLSNGRHNITVYAMDEAGNTGASETICFSVEVPESFPTVLVAIVSIGLVAGIGAGLLVYFKKRKH
jgi:hypothetical protein